MAENIPAATKLRNFIENSNETLLCPGVYDGFSTRIALSVGFDALYMTGAGTTASRLGHADLGIATQADMRAHAEMIANIDPRTPVIADADTGYGGPIMVARTVEQYARAGVAGLHIEDQVQTKRCGHLGGKDVVDLDVFASRIRAAVEARKRIGSDIVIIARTDSLQGKGYDEAIRRLRFVRDLGADVGFLEGMTSVDMFRSAVKDLAPWPLLLNMVEGGITPTVSVAEAQEIGLRIIIHPLASITAAYQPIKDQFEKLKTTGRMDHDPKLTPQFIFNVCGLKESMAVDAEAGGKAFSVEP
ncbi:hypothetical protein PVAG01_08534 [Phlyctema vagabunda]|uniref:Carboxyphosphonoenolpyruvate phosphonomutase n=1 Tax=Phlyctema vagabunda TaxID=108571 RepID=A0ABR4P9R8_9HELO